MIFRYLNYLSKRRMENGLIDIGLGDWCQTGKAPDHPDCSTLVTDSIMCTSICERAAFIFDVIGLRAQKEFAATLATEFRDAVRSHLIDFSDMLVAGNTQCGQAMALFCYIFEEEEKEEAYLRLKEMIRKNGDHFNCGMIGVRMIFHVLAEFGDAELAYRMITRTDYPSYGMWTTQNLTTLPETFTEKADMRAGSLNHHFMGDISDFFITKIAGIRVNPQRDDPASVRIAPNFVSQLDFAKAEYHTVGGKIRTMWKRLSDGRIALAIEKAEGVKAEGKLPLGYVFSDRSDEGGDFSADGFTVTCRVQSSLKGKNIAKSIESGIYLVEKQG